MKNKAPATPKAPARKKAAATPKAPARKKAATNKPKAAPARKLDKPAKSAPGRPGISPAGTGTDPEQGALFEPDAAIRGILDERLLLPMRVAALAFHVSETALKKWKVKARQQRGRESLYYLPDLVSYRLARADQNENSLAAERARLARTQAEKCELEVKQLRGDLIPASVILESWLPLVAAARQKVMAIKTKVKTQIPRLTADELKKVDVICRSALEDLANGGIPKSARKSTKTGI